MAYGRKISGGRYHKQRKNKKYELHNPERHTLLGETKTKQLRVRGGSMKTIILKTDIANVVIKGKTKQVKITKVEETPANRFYARQNRLMKGAVITTEAGKARITNRPSQEGQINAILVQ
ncbi:30S ribosomal protein S8e [Candidatus Pacearchaeota archaeon]|nr:30S ribosomal protein S8e [Candidatus Pacearchaeota archaeon]